MSYKITKYFYSITLENFATRYMKIFCATSSRSSYN